jgi:Fe-S oxidoreductase
MCAETDALFSRSLNLLNELLNRYPSDLPFNDPVRAFVRLLDKHKDNTGIPDEEECYGMLFLVLVQAYAHALGAARELAEALSRQYCHSSACLARIVFEDLITMLYILSDREKNRARTKSLHTLV